VHADHGHTIAAILRILEEAGRPLGSTKIARSLRVVGVDWPNAWSATTWLRPTASA